MAQSAHRLFTKSSFPLALARAMTRFTRMIFASCTRYSPTPPAAAWTRMVSCALRFSRELQKGIRRYALNRDGARLSKGDPTGNRNGSVSIGSGIFRISAAGNNRRDLIAHFYVLHVRANLGNDPCSFKTENVRKRF